MSSNATIEWKGKRYTLPARRHFPAIEAIEIHHKMTRGQLARMAFEIDPPILPLARAWAAVLRMATDKDGAPMPITDADAYDLLCAKPASESIMDRPATKAAIDLLSIMLLPEQLADVLRIVEDVEAGKEPSKPAPLAAAAA